MKKILALMAGVALLFTSTIFTSCSDSDDDSSSSSSSSGKTGSIVGVVLDNRGEPVEGATVTLGTKSATTNYGGEFEITNVAVNDAKKVTDTSSVIAGDGTNTVTTAYTLTAKKDGYLSSTVKGIYVTYEEKETVKSATYRAALSTSLQAQYATILNTYAGNTTNSTQAATTIVGTAAGTDVGYSQTTTNTNDISSVMTIIANALKDLESLYKDTEFNVETYADFASAALIPCDASFTGALKLNLTPIEASSYSAETFVPKSKPTVRMSYTPTDKNAYTFTAKVDENGKFEFKNLPSGVALSFTVDAFTETIDNTEYYFSGEAARYILDNSTAYQTAPLGATVTLGSGDSNEKSCVLMLHAQKDKNWVTDSNVIASATGTLLSVKDPLTFTFNKEMKVLELTSTNISDITAGRYTVTIDSTDAKKVTVTPIDGVWTLTNNPATITLKGEAVDGTKVIIGGNKGTVTEAAGAAYAATYDAYFDTYIWASIVTESHNNEDSALALNTPIVLEFSKPMSFANVTITGTANTFTKAFSEDKKTLTLTPKNTYWDITTPAANNTTVVKEVTITVTGEDTDGNTTVGYWKTNSAATGLKAFFIDTLDVTLANISTATQEAFTIKFNKEIKSFDVKGTNNLVSITAKDTNAVTDYTVEFDGKDTVTVKARDGLFAKEGPYTVTLKDIEPVDGSDMVREAGKSAAKAYVTSKTYTFKTSDFNFSYEGVKFLPTAIEVVDSIPSTAVESRAIVSVTTDKALKFTFNKEVQKSEITVKVDDETATAKNYIDSADKKVVYVPLDGVKKVNESIVLGGKVTAVCDVVTTTGSGTSATSTHSDQIEFTSEKLEKWFNNNVTTYKIYAALNLTGTSLIKGIDHVTGKAEYSKADPISVGDSVTFTFDADLTGYKASYKIFGLKDVDNDAETKANIKVLVENGEATVAGKTVTVNDAAFKAKKSVGAEATYYLELRVDNAAGIKVFSTTSPYFGATENSFEAKAKTMVYDAPADTNPDSNTNDHANYGSFIVKVAEKDILVDTSLIETTTAALSKATYKAAKAVPAKSAITFTFANELAADTTASYELYDVSTANSRKVVSSGDATIAGKVVTVQDNLMVAGQPTVNGKKITTVAQDAETGITSYFLKLEVKDAAGTVIFSSDNNLWTAPATGATDKRTDLQKALIGLITDGLFKVEVAPLAIENLSFVEEDKDNFNVGLKTYKATGINPKTDVTIKFNASIPAGAKYTYAIKNGSKDVAKSAEGGVAVAAATDTITIPGEKLVAATDKINGYKLTLKVKEGDNVLFDTENAWLGKVTDYEKKLADSNNPVKFTSGTADVNVIDGALNIPVIKTQIVTKDDAKGNKSKTTKDDDKDFKKSYKSPIVLQFSHPVENYTVKLYKATKLYTAKKDSYTGTASADFTKYAKEAEDNTEATKLTDFVKDGAEYIFESAQTISDDKKVITVTPANFFDMGTTVNIAVFNEKGEYVAVRDDSSETYTTAKVVTFETSNVAADYAQKLADSVTEAVTVDNSAASTTLKIKTDKADIGNNAAVELTIPTECSTLSGEMPKYTVYVKPADGVYAQSGTNNDFGKDTDGADMSAANFNLGREAAKTTVLATAALNPTTAPVVYPFKYNGTVEGIVVKVLDGKHTVYKFTLTDQKEPVLTVTADNSITLSTFVKNKTTGVYQADITSTFGADKTTSEAARKDFTLTVTGDEWLKSVTAAVSETTSTATGLAENAKKKTEQKKAIKYLTGETSATIAFTEAYWFIDDTITIKATDASGNESTYEIRIK